MEKLLASENGILETTETLSDGSKVYNIRICVEVNRDIDSDIKIMCTNIRQAEKLANLLRKTICITKG
jgi:hypothetical protein